MLDHKIAKKQIARLMGLSGKPDSTEALGELITVLGGLAHSEAHAVATVNVWLESNDFTPTPHQLREALHRQLEGFKESMAPRAACRECALPAAGNCTDGWRRVAFLVQRNGKGRVQLSEEQEQAMKGNLAHGEWIADSRERCPQWSI